ncbi:hydantoinase/oxoprolinase family protein [Oricola sp.]|uniref:hydantoinase/oxoprolinase family protein n=1 Tax=Oricola sp. TaxID=1979950 RepID=UPI0025D70581|nr:hydantoinase/oxoprolinase family protein [Oricola sp.]MCI5077820.1 hydantoinase/oxoprolinase family protein [Oricola sp.]
MSLSLGIDTGGTYTDAVIHDERRGVIAKAKALTTRHDLAIGLGEAMAKVLETSRVAPAGIGLVSISTTLATNALVEGQGGRIALVMIGFAESDLDRAGLKQALGDDPVIVLPGGHDAHGRARPLDLTALEATMPTLADRVSAAAVAGYFAVRNPEHEITVRDLIRARTGLPVTASHELSAKLDGPRRALTTVLNARLIALIDRLITAAAGRMEKAGVRAPLMVVRGDGSLVSADFARARPIETILSGPAASLVGARHLAGIDNAIIADIGGTTTDIAILDRGRPRIDPQGATVGGHRTMVDAVAMRTFGLGGDSEVKLGASALTPELALGPRRLVPLSLVSHLYGPAVTDTLERQMRSNPPARNEGRFALRAGVPDALAAGLSRMEGDLFSRLTDKPQPLDRLLTATALVATLDRLAARGLVLISGFTPSDAQHVLGRFSHWDRRAAELGAALFARRKDGAGNPLSSDAETISRRVIDRLVRLSAERVLETALCEDGLDGAVLATSPLARRAMDAQGGIARLSLTLDRPLVGLGAGAAACYPEAGALLATETLIPDHADVANAVGAVVGQVRVSVSAEIVQPTEGRFEITGLADNAGTVFTDAEAALTAAEALCRGAAERQAHEAGAGAVTASVTRDVRTATIEDRAQFVSATVTAIASGRPATAAA